MIRSLISIFSLVFLTGNLWADVPQQLHYQGYLTNAVGEQIDCPDPVQCDEQYDIRFRIYDSEVSGVVLWEETHGDIAIFLGSFHALLGQAEPIHGDLMAGPRWLAISINGAPDLTPRQKMVSAAYALRANVADNATTAINATQLGGIDAGDFALTANVDAEDNDVLGSLICAEGQIARMTAGVWACAQAPDNDTLAALPCVDGEFAQMVGGVWTCVGKSPGIPTSMPGPCNAESAGVMYLDAAAGLVWVCDGSIYNKLKYCGGLCADPSTLPCGTPIVDDCGDACTATGTGLNLAACPDPASMPCGVVVEDGCGNSCGVTGQAPNPALCADPATVACGEAISDSCGHSCSTTGQAYNAANCADPASVPCGQITQDSCGNSCGANGTGLDVSTCGDPTALACTTPMEDACGNDCGFSGSFCEGDVTCTATGCGPCLGDWLVGTPCNGVSYGNGCSPEQTGYHFVGVFNNGGQQWACWWHQKNQAWNTTSATNLYNLGLHFGLTNFNGGAKWCHHKTVNPCSVDACANDAGSYFNPDQTGAWGWCAESDPNNGGFACFPDPGVPACP